MKSVSFLCALEKTQKACPSPPHPPPTHTRAHTDTLEMRAHTHRKWSVRAYAYEELGYALSQAPARTRARAHTRLQKPLLAASSVPGPWLPYKIRWRRRRGKSHTLCLARDEGERMHR